MKYSIITINLNNSAGLRKTIESVVNQTFQDFEYIIIDGGSTDASVDIIKEYSSRIDYWVSEPDRGIYNAMNKGIVQAHGDYINFMNSGDCFYDNNVLNDVSYYLNYDVVLGKYEKNGIISGYDHDLTLIDFFKGSINHQSSFIRSGLFNDSLYSENYKIVSDWLFFLDKLVFNNASLKNINRIIVDYDCYGISSLSKDLYDKERFEILKSKLPEKIFMDYYRLYDADSILMELTPYLNKTYRLNLLVYKLIKSIIYLHKMLKKNHIQY